MVRADTKTDWLIGAYGVSAFVDTTTSAYGFGKGDVHEVNPLLKPFQKHPVAFGLVKGTMHGLVVYFLLKNKDAHPEVVKWMALILLSSQVAVDTSNIVLTKTVKF